MLDLRDDDCHCAVYGRVDVRTCRLVSCIGVLFCPYRCISEHCNSLFFIMTAYASLECKTCFCQGRCGLERPVVVGVLTCRDFDKHRAVLGRVLHKAFALVSRVLTCRSLPYRRVGKGCYRRLFLVTTYARSLCRTRFGCGRILRKRPRAIGVSGRLFNRHRDGAVCRLVHFETFASVCCILTCIDCPHRRVAQFCDGRSLYVSASARSRCRACRVFRRCRCDCPCPICMSMFGLSTLITSNEQNGKYRNDCNHKHNFVSLHCRSPYVLISVDTI